MDWHRRYLQQAQWTRDLRAYLFRQAGLSETGAHRTVVLEVGCGTGAILTGLPDNTSPHGLDIDPEALAQCRVHAPSALLVQGNALRLPYSSSTFDIVYCHFLLLWVKDPLQALLEMKRVANVDGHVIAFAEPDYTARVDEPRELESLGQWQAESLRRQGADPALGVRLADLFYRAGIELLETGRMQSTENDPSAADWETEWAVLESDLAGFIPASDLDRMKTLDERARAQGKRRLHVPTYFAWGHV